MLGSSLDLEESTPESELDGMLVLETVEDGISEVVTPELLSATLEDGLGGMVGRTSVDDSTLEVVTSTLEELEGTSVISGMELLDRTSLVLEGTVPGWSVEFHVVP